MIKSSFNEFYTDVLVPDLSIKEIKLANSDKLFYEVKCTAGTHAKLEGYWLVGKKMTSGLYLFLWII